MYLSRHLRLLPKANIARSLNGGGVHYTTASSAAPAEDSPIQIPNRIQRSPTDLLQALAGTVGRDSTAPHYKYHDDPFLIPMSNAAKRTYAMSKESGRKAAQWIKEEHRDLFLHQEAEPSIEKFAPSMVYTEDSQVDESSLSQLISQGELKDAVLVYNLIDKNQHRIPGTPSETALQEFVEASIQNKSPSQALTALQYAVDNNMESSTLARRIHNGFTLNETHLAKLKSLVGESFLEK